MKKKETKAGAEDLQADGFGSRIFKPNELEELARLQLENALDAHRKGLGVYASLKNLNEDIGTQYGDRVLFELIQNAHDAHRSDGKGEIAIRLVAENNERGRLLVANRGHGFDGSDLNAIRNIDTSEKEIGEGIGNKGLGFRSIEALTDDPRIYSKSKDIPQNRFTGYCFRFATRKEIESLLTRVGASKPEQRQISENISPYLVPLPLEKQPNEIAAYAQEGFATVVVLPLQSVDAVKLAQKQVETLMDPNAPLLLFLDRIAQVRIDIELPNQPAHRHCLHRHKKQSKGAPNIPGYTIDEVTIDKDHRFLLVRREVERTRVLAAVEESIPMARKLRKWRSWKGKPTVSVAVGLSKQAVTEGRLYNFLPMGEKAASPVIGHLDAPFFGDIDRRDANLTLPLNKTLMEAAAEACAVAAQLITEHGLGIPSQAAFDLFAWTGEHASKLDEALKEAGSSLSEAQIVPTMPKEGRKEWTDISQIRIWPAGDFKVLEARSVAKHTDARLVSDGMDVKRIERLRKIAHRASVLSLEPTGKQLAEWSESYAESLLDQRASPQTWSDFYDDLHGIFQASRADLSKLSGKRILCNRSGRLQAAGSRDDATQATVFVQSDVLGNVPEDKRKKKDDLLPPATLVRRLGFLDKQITFRREALNAFLEAGLVREYDPVEVLGSLKSILGESADDAGRWEALQWAFQVWRVKGSSIKDALHEADLRVPTLSG